ncbi:MAG TPA: hypothetical protein DHV25_01060 [Candidatus Kerfeldbacteria bacterium]|nr:MAG: hypothetical protein UY52_C0001G0046 [Parcubacteria group bacterium GW2011_GWC2_49_9]HCJ52293.1 hypothetical protein [Candidatus Kerfeldbacteria bacterium]
MPGYAGAIYTMKRLLFERITVREWRFVAVVCAVLVAVTLIPHLYGVFSSPSGMHYSGIHHLTPGDTNVYLSMISTAKEGENQFIDLYTSEKQSGLYVNPFWYAIGIGARLFDLSPLTALQASRVALIPAFLLVMYLFLSWMSSSQTVRRVALLLIVFSSGLGVFLNPILFLRDNPVRLPVDTWVPEAIPFLTLYHNPHLLASLTLIIFTFLCMLLAFHTHKIRYSVIAGLSGMAVTSFHPFNAPTIVVVILIYLVVTMVRTRRMQWEWIMHVGLLGTLMLPAAAYLLTLQAVDPVVAEWNAQNILPSPSPLMYLIGFIFMIVFGAYAVVKKQGRTLSHPTLVYVWIIVSVLLIYSPLHFQRRMVEGLFIPLAILAAIGMVHLWERLRVSRRPFIYQTTVLMFLVVFLPLTNVQIVLQDIQHYSATKSLPYYITDQEVESLSWLQSHTVRDAVILSTAYSGNFIPAYSLRRVYIGHGPQTLFLTDKKILVDKFFSSEMSSAEEESFLREFGITHIFIGQVEQEHSLPDFSSRNFLELVFSNTDVSIYRVISH